MSYFMLNYTHSDPLFESLNGKVRVQRGTPAEALKNILDHKSSAAMVSLVSYLENGEALDLLPTANIHSMSTTGSTLLVSNGNLMAKRMEIAVTGATRTTSHYLSMILNRMRVDFKLKTTEYQDADSLLSESNYALVIGDEALRVYGTKHRIVMDVGFEFSRLYSMIPVYAVTVAAKDYSGSIADEINIGMKDHTNFNRQCASMASGRLGISEEIMDWYFRLIGYEYSSNVAQTVELVRNSL